MAGSGSDLNSLNVYRVGGAVRDQLLGLPIKDQDYVVVGATPDALISLGFKPVGKDFPVFLHPNTHEEYALARTERKTAPGYRGFVVHASPDVTLAQDLARRDFTINAIAMDAEGNLIDPFGGCKDIEAKCLRHVSDAFVEDPVRILRAARFLARFTAFEIAPETMALMQSMVDAGEVDALVPERVWQEVAKGLMESKPSRMFEMLRACGALARLMPELDRLWGVPQPAQYHPEIDTGVHAMMVIDYAAKQGFDLPTRFAALTHDLGKGTTPKEILPRHIGHEERSVHLLVDLSERLRVPNDCKELAKLVAKYHGKLHQVGHMRADTIVEFLMQLDVLRQPQRFERFLQACEADTRGRTGYEHAETTNANRLMSLYHVVSRVDASAIAKTTPDPEQIKQSVFQARVEAVKAFID